LRRFLLELALAAVAALAVIGLLEVAYRDYRTYVDRRLDGLLPLADRIEQLVVGGSHTGTLGERALHPGQSVYNTCIGGQDLRRSLLLSRALLPRLPRLREVIVQLDYDTIGYDLASGGQDWMDRQYFPYTGQLDRDGLMPRLLARSSFMRANRDLSHVLRFLAAPPPADAGLLPLGLDPRRRVDPEECRRRALEHSRVKFNAFLVPQNERVLEDFARLGPESGVQFVFVNTPKAGCYVEAYDPATRELGRRVIGEATARLRLRFVDLFGAPGFDDAEDFVDFDHLSSAGAEKVMRRLQ
jgi:hypothetical protein